jgi:NAD(P)-dependent dehydrogenase (short-subunit alcohol dehydrogenase family)
VEKAELKPLEALKEELKEKELREQSIAKQDRLKQLFTNSLMDKKFSIETFENWDSAKGNKTMYNVGIKYCQKFNDYQWEDFSRKVNDELKAMFYLCKAVVPEMIERRNGSIIAVSSTMSKTAENCFIAHSTAKAALDAFVRSLANEIGQYNVRVNTVAPGLTLTDATANLSPQRKDAASARCPLRRNGLPSDVAGAILFLSSDLSQFMTGTYIPVDGGFTML